MQQEHQRSHNPCQSRSLQGRYTDERRAATAAIGVQFGEGGVQTADETSEKGD